MGAGRRELSLPLDDLARRKVVAEFQERLEREGAAEALDWLRKQIGEEAFRQWWLRAGEGDVVRVSAEEAEKVAGVLRESGFAQVWVDAASGRVYTSVARPEALEVAQKLAQAVQEGAGAEEVQALVRALARLSTRNGEAEVVVLGPWYVPGGMKGFYIQQTLARDEAFFDMGEAWDLVRQRILSMYTWIPA